MPGLVKRTLLVGAAIQVLLFAIVFCPRVAAASTTGSVLTTSPVSINLSTAPGKTISTVLQAQNNSQQTETISVRLDKFKVQGSSGQPAIYTPPPADVSTSWVHFSPTSFVAEPGIWTKVTMTISVPPYAALGYYYAVLFTPNATVKALSANTNAVKGSNAVLVLVDTNSKNEQKQLHVTGFTTQKSLYEFLPAKFNITVQNSGNIHLIPQGDIFISRAKGGKTIASLSINSGQGNVLPNSNRQFQVQWSDGFPAFGLKRINGQIVSDSHGRPIQQLQWNFSSSLSKIRFGKYYAHMLLVYNNGVEDVPINGYVSFWVIPWRLIALFVCGLAAVIGLWKFLEKLVGKLRKRSRS
jgi:hypothetical protein